MFTQIPRSLSGVMDMLNTIQAEEIKNSQDIADLKVVKSTIIELPQFVISQTAAVALTLGVRNFVKTGLTGLLATDRCLIYPQNTPDGYLVGLPKVTAEGTINVPILCPALALGQGFSITFRAFAIR